MLVGWFLLFSPLESFGWGFWAHKRINRIACFTLPVEMIDFYKSHIEHITEHAVDPDKRRYAVKEEAPRHYIDLDHFGEYPFDSFPRKWSDAVEMYTEDTLLIYGILPWHITWTMKNLTQAFIDLDKDRILRYSCDLGHYVGDAHVPLHTTENYNGHMTDQKGIHGFWESRLPELFAEDYNYFVGKAKYIDDPLEQIWTVILESHRGVDTVLTFEKTLTHSHPSDQKFSYEQRGQQTVRVYSEEFSEKYHLAMDNMVERRMRKAIKCVGDIWFTCWVDAGQPDLTDIQNKDLTEEEIERIAQEEKMFQQGNIKGREHSNEGFEVQD